MKHDNKRKQVAIADIRGVNTVLVTWGFHKIELDCLMLDAKEQQFFCRIIAPELLAVTKGKRGGRAVKHV